MTPEQRVADAEALYALIERRLKQPDALELLAATEVESEGNDAS
jgi:hypothetical protein